MGVFDDLSLLRAFVSIVENGSISAAARRLRVAQPTLSRQLASLEEKCGVAVLRRDTHTMNLTETGHQLLADAKAILALAEESEHRVRNEQQTLEGHIRVFATIDFGQSVVSRLVAGFLQDHPAVTAELSLSNRPLHVIQEGCDAGFIAGEITDESVVARSVGKIHRYPALSPTLLETHGSITTPEDLKSWPWITLVGAQFGGPKEITLETADRDCITFSVPPVMMSEGITSIREAVRAGLGVAILPDWLIREDIVSGRLVRVLHDWHATPLSASVVYPVQRMLPARVRRFIEFAVAYLTAVLSPHDSR
jgi:DNA-binding transcriptional LysR family regulator